MTVLHVPPYVIPIKHDLVEFYEPTDEDETEYDLKPRVQRWLKQNCNARWNLMEDFVGTGVRDTCVIEFSVGFQDERDAILFKMRWC